jgi:Ca-activated chloride channel family protein
MSLLNPWILLLIPIYIALELWIFFRLKTRSIDIPAANYLKARKTWRTTAIRFSRFLPAAAAVLLLFILAGPRFEQKKKETLPSGIDIILALDASGSMAAEDFQPQNRLEVAKDVLKDFVRGRPSDRIGLVIFGGKSLTRVPLTLQHNQLLNAIGKIRFGVVPEGTAIGSAIMSSLNRLIGSEGSHKGDRILLLITDGRNNAGEVHPFDALEIAVKQKVKIYTVGVGSLGKAPFPYYTAEGKKAYRYDHADLDEPLMREIAKRTGGQYFRATDPKSLSLLFQNINQLEKSENQSLEYRMIADKVRPFLWPAVILIFCYLFLTLYVVKIP